MSEQNVPGQEKNPMPRRKRFNHKKFRFIAESVLKIFYIIKLFSPLFDL